MYFYRLQRLPTTSHTLVNDDDSQAQSSQNAFLLSRSETIPRSVLQLHTVSLAQKSVRFLLADKEPACSDLLIGLRVLEHLKVDTGRML